MLRRLSHNHDVLYGTRNTVDGQSHGSGDREEALTWNQ